LTDTCAVRNTSLQDKPTFAQPSQTHLFKFLPAVQQAQLAPYFEGGSDALVHPGPRHCLAGPVWVLANPLGSRLCGM